MSSVFFRIVPKKRYNISSTSSKKEMIFPLFPIKEPIFTTAFLSLGAFYYLILNKRLYIVENFTTLRCITLDSVYKDTIYVYRKRFNILLVTTPPTAMIEARNLLGFRIARLHVPGLFINIQSVIVLKSYIFITSYANQLITGYIEHNYNVRRLKYIKSMHNKLNLRNKRFLVHEVCCSDRKCSGNIKTAFILKMAAECSNQSFFGLYDVFIASN